MTLHYICTHLNRKGGQMQGGMARMGGGVSRGRKKVSLMRR